MKKKNINYSTTYSNPQVIQDPTHADVSVLESKKKTLTHIAQVVQGRRAFMVGITNRSIMQTDWEMRIARAISDNKSFQFEYREFGQKFLKTESKLLYAFSGSLFSDILDFNNTEDIFFIVFV